MAEPLIIRLVDEFRQNLLEREAASVAEMSRRWLAVEAALSDQALRLAEEVTALKAAGETVGPGKLYRLQRYQQLLAQTQAQLSRFNQTAQGQIEAAVLQNAAQGIQDAIALIQTAAGTEVIAFARLNVEAAERVAALARAGQPLGAIIERSYPLAVEAITNKLITGIALGVNPRETARRMVQEGLAEGLNHILLVARDQQIRAYREGGRQQYLTSGVVLKYRRHAAKQPGRTCLACIALDGTLYDTAEMMPLHPQDRCAMIPVVEGLPPVEWTSGEAYFRSLPPEVQADWLGPGRWELWQEGRLPFEKLVTIKENDIWGPSAQVTSLADLLKGKGGGGGRSPWGGKPGPKPAPKPGMPAGIPVSQALDTGKLPKSGKVGTAVKNTLAVIDGIHGDGELPTIPIKSNSSKSYFGKYIYYRGGQSKEIVISTYGTHPMITTAHEIGHFLDHRAELAGKPVVTGLEATQIYNRSPEMYEVMRSISQSGAYKKLEQLKQQKVEIEYTNFRGETVKAMVSVDKKYISYLQRPAEAFARAYAQYITVKSNNPAMKEELDKMRWNGGKRVPITDQWDDDDFEPILAAFDKLFVSKGYMQ